MAKRIQPLDPRDPDRLDRIRKMRAAARNKRRAKNKPGHRRMALEGQPLFSEVQRRRIRFLGQQHQRILAGEVAMAT